MSESAFIVRVPEAEPYVGRYRDRFDPVARLGVPAHITILYPFMPLELISEQVMAAAQTIVASVGEFTFHLSRVERFPGTLYLAPEPAAPFVALTHAFSRAFPEYPPYRGEHSSIIPHLTVAHADESQQSAIEAELRGALSHAAGIDAICREVVMIENSTGRWSELRTFPLGPSP